MTDEIYEMIDSAYKKKPNLTVTPNGQAAASYAWWHSGKHTISEKISIGFLILKLRLRLGYTLNSYRGRITFLKKQLGNGIWFSIT